MYEFMRHPDPKDVVVFDLDSTICDTRPRQDVSPLNDPTSSWEKYAQACDRDELIVGTARLVQLLWSVGMRVHLVSWRHESARDATVTWLRRFRIPFSELQLASGQDSGADYKVQYLNSLIGRDLNPILYVDDWPTNAAAVQAMGIPSICVNGYFD